ncbi:MAG TPA: hypothetical protein VK930_02430, partial [Verrucomicrobiae bacterium]|nr:hypothetical protein [Verrucomicrobiae bacterium]
MKKLGMVFAAVLTLLLTGALLQMPGSAPPRDEKTAPPTFYKDVLPILQDKCQSCHRSGEAAPMSLATYEQTRPWATKIAAS